VSARLNEVEELGVGIDDDRSRRVLGFVADALSGVARIDVAALNRRDREPLMRESLVAGPHNPWGFV
jgi:hypothetical protein